jgi:NAD(P)H-dependent flavin oxidoreductase YrpB (nitropropane dioxygenase family)
MASLIHETYLVKQKFIKRNSPNDESSLFRVTPEEVKKIVNIIPAIIADGGMKNYSDIIKAFALGADHVAIGSIFNKALESCADNYLYGIKIGKKFANYLFDKGYPIKKYFRGMSTKEAQKAMGKTVFKTSEGVVRYRRVEYHLQGWVENFEHYLRNAMSYSNAKTLQEFIGKANICWITDKGYDRFNK